MPDHGSAPPLGLCLGENGTQFLPCPLQSREPLGWPFLSPFPLPCLEAVTGEVKGMAAGEHLRAEPCPLDVNVCLFRVSPIKR